MGRIIVFTEDDCSKSHLVKTTLDSKNIPYTEINLSSYPKRRPDMIGLCNSVSTPQVFFNNDYVGSPEELIKLLRSWEKESEFSGYNTVRQRVKIEILSAESPRDKRLRSPRSKEMKKKEKTDESDRINGITLPNGTIMDACKITHILMNYLPRSKVIYKTKLFYNVSSGRALIETLKKLNLVETNEEAINLSQKLQDLRVIKSLSKAQVFDAKVGHYRLQPLHDSSILNSFCFWISHTGTGEVSDNPLMTLRELSKMMEAIIEKSTIGKTKKIDRKAAKKSNLHSNFEQQVCKLQVIDVDNFDLRTKVAFFINLYNLIVEHIMVRLNISTLTQKHLTTLKYNVGGYLLSLDDIEHGILRGNSPKPGKKVTQFSSSDARNKLSLHGKDRRIHFALNHGGTMSLGSYQYTREAIDLELQLAAETFCAMDHEVKINEWKRELVLPLFMKIYLEDFCSDLSKLPKAVAGFLNGKKLMKLDNVMNASKDSYGKKITIKFEGPIATIYKKKINIIRKDNVIIPSEVPTPKQEANKFSGDSLGQIPETISVCDQVENNSIGEVTCLTFDVQCTNDFEGSSDEIGSYHTNENGSSNEIGYYRESYKENFVYSKTRKKLFLNGSKFQSPDKPVVPNKIISPSERTSSTGERTASTVEESADSKLTEYEEVKASTVKACTVPAKSPPTKYNIEGIEEVGSYLESPKNTFDIEIDGVATNSSTLTDNSGPHSSNSNDIVSKLAHLVSLKNMGALTDEEFKAAKSVVIAEGESAVLESSSKSIHSLQDNTENVSLCTPRKDAIATYVPNREVDEVAIPSIDCSFDDLDDIINQDDSDFFMKNDEEQEMTPELDDDNNSLFSGIFDSEIEKIVTGMRTSI